MLLPGARHHSGRRARSVCLGRARTLAAASLLVLSMVFSLGTAATAQDSPSQDSQKVTDSRSEEGVTGQSGSASDAATDAQSQSRPDSESPDDSEKSGDAGSQEGTDTEAYSDVPTPRAYDASLSAASLSCSPGDFYTISKDGKVYKGTSVDGTANSGVDQAFSFPKTKSGHPYNSLAIGQGGDLAYALTRDDGGSMEVTIYRRTSDGTIKSFPKTLPRGIDKSKHIIAGGMNPSAGDQSYYFGGFNKESPKGFMLYKFTPNNGGQVKFVGRVPMNIPDGKNDVNNGDLAFNSHGDLFILWHYEGKHSKDMRLYAVRKKTLDNANGGTLHAGGSATLKAPYSGSYNGAAFDSDGRLLLQHTKDASSVFSVDPSTGESLSSEVKLHPSVNGTDLASCANPSSIALLKDVKSRAKATDQFRLQIQQQGSGISASTVTSGSNDGIQDDFVGPIPAISGKTYILSESVAGGGSLDDYASSLACYDADTSLPVDVQRQKQGEYKVKVPTHGSVAIECYFTNTPKPVTGEVTWRKTASDTGQILSGSAWQIIPDDGSPAIDVADNTGAPGYSGRDADPAVGIFRVADLPVGGYTLHEKAVPAGYTPGADRHFEVKKQKKPGSISGTVDLGDIENDPIAGEVVWQKVDVDDQLIAGSVWTFTPIDPAGIPQTIEDCTGIPCGAGGDQDPLPGVFQLSSVPFGKYQLTEKTAPDGYIKSDETKTVVVKNSGATVNVGKIINRRLPAVSWRKVEDSVDGELLEGSVWTWKPTKPGGAPIDIEDCVAVSAEFCTGYDTDPGKGQFLLRDVKPGKYTLTEKTPPAGGYRLDDTPHEVTITKNQLDQTVELGSFINVKLRGTVTWSKVDADDADGALLKGSTWTLTGGAVPANTVITDCEAAPCGTGPYDDKDPEPGKFKLDQLPFGDYTLIEKTAPVGFEVDSTAHHFTISDASLDIAFGDFPNRRRNVPGLPLTGGMSADRIIIFGTGVVLLAGVLAFVSRRRRAAA